MHPGGTPRGAHDLIIAATAAATKRTIITDDRRVRSGDLPGIACIQLVDEPRWSSEHVRLELCARGEQRISRWRRTPADSAFRRAMKDLDL